MPLELLPNSAPSLSTCVWVMSFPLSWILLDVLLEENLNLFCPNTRESSHTKYQACFQKPNYFSWHHTLPQSTQKKDKTNSTPMSSRWVQPREGGWRTATPAWPFVWTQRNGAAQQEFSCLKSSVKQPGNGFHTHSYRIDLGWFIASAVAIYPQYWETE